MKLQPGHVGNDLLSSLPYDVYQSLRPKMVQVEHDKYETLASEDQEISSVYFPISGWISMVTRFASGGSAEVGIVGAEGMVGLPVVLGGQRSSAEWMVQAPGTFLKMNTAAFRRALCDQPDLKAVLLRYALAFQRLIAQTAACNLSHRLDQRLARWLLLVHDRSNDEFPITQDLLSIMLGVRRAGVSVAAGVLQKAGVIQYRRGRLKVLDRAGLEAAACECYGVAKRRFDQALDVDGG